MRSLITFALAVSTITTSCGKDDPTDESLSELDAATIAAAGQPVGGQSAQWRRTSAPDITAPPELSAFTARPGVNLGEVELSLSYPDISGDYNKIDLRRLSGLTPPSDCTKGAVAVSVTDFLRTAFDDVGLIPGEKYSYIACIYDESENLTATLSSTAASASAKQRLFVTSLATFDGNFKADYGGSSFDTGLAGADFRCQSLADASGIRGQWQAVIADMPERNVRYSLPIYGPIVNLASPAKTIAFDADDLWNGELRAAIGVDENGASALPTFDSGGSAITSAFVFSSFSYNGSSTSYYSCDHWTSSSASLIQVAGNNKEVDGSWAWDSIGNTCDKTGRLYCLEQPASGAYTAPAVTITNNSAGKIDVTVDFPSDTSNYVKLQIVRQFGKNFQDKSCQTYLPYGQVVKTYYGTTVSPFIDETFTDTTNQEGWFRYSACLYDRFGNLQTQNISGSVETGSSANYKRAFITSATYDGNLGGVAGANTKCQDAATAASLGTYKALLMDSSSFVSASNNITISEPTFDFAGNFIGRYIYDITGGRQLSPQIISTDENGTTIPAASKVWTGSSVSGYNSGSTCTNWTVNTSSVSGSKGNPDTSWTSTWISDGTITCDSVAHLYCIEQ